MARHSSPAIRFVGFAFMRLSATSSFPSSGYSSTASSPPPLSESLAVSLLQSSKNVFASKRIESLADDDDCDLTVSYLFVVADDIPLARVWRKWLDGCPRGSYTLHIHSQSSSTTPPSQFLAEAILVPNATQGPLRFSYAMQDAMLKLYGSASQRAAPNGCTPRWAQMLSDSCAPIRSCSEYRTELASHVGSSLIQKIESGLRECPIPVAWDENSFLKQSQWSTLWMEHAKLLLEHEDKNYPVWKSHCLPDEHYACNILNELGANITWYGLTQIMNGFGENGHPNLQNCRAHTSIVLGQEPASAAPPAPVFARKFARECEQSLLKDVEAMNATPAPAPMIHVATL